MAENIVAGLFGLTPQMYGEQQRRSALREGIDLASLTPGEAGAAMTYAGARGLGGAIAGALGVEDPQLQRITQRQQLLGMIDPSNPDSYLQAAKR
jgi:methylphosphotriester-DNA--protein-cysteine methyltransferase